MMWSASTINRTIQTFTSSEFIADLSDYTGASSFAGTGALRLNANTVNTFGSTSNNTGYEGDFVWVGANASVIVKTAENNVFLPTDRKIQINAATGSIQVNTANVYQGNKKLVYVVENQTSILSMYDIRCFLPQNPLIFWFSINRHFLLPLPIFLFRWKLSKYLCCREYSFLFIYL